MTDSSPLRVRGLGKQFSRVPVFTDWDLDLGPGEALALRGRNGAGKSTLIGCICGTVIPDSGTVEIGGHNLVLAPLRARAALRYLPQEVEFPAGITGRELLIFYAQVFNHPDGIDTAIRLAALGEAIDHLSTTYSVGMRRRLAFAGLTLGKAELYVLDEPFAGLDAESRQRYQRWLHEAQRGGAGILLAAHEQEQELLELLAARSVNLEDRS